MDKKSSIKASTHQGVTLNGLLILGLILGSHAAAQSQKPKHDPSSLPGTYSVAQTGRPLAEILLQLQQAFLSPINYEEVPYESSSELQSKIISTAYGSMKLLFTPQTSFSAGLSQDDSTPYLALHSVFAQYKSAGLYGADGYQVIQQTSRIDVVPFQVLGANGSWHSVVPVMSHVVTFPASERTVEDTLTVLLEQVSQASGKKVLLMSDPFASYTGRITLGAGGELPGDIIAKIAQTLGVTLSYQCTFDASNSVYYVNIYPVAATVSGSLYNNKAPGAAQTQPAHSVFFTKDLP